MLYLREKVEIHTIDALTRIHVNLNLAPVQLCGVLTVPS